ncbi:UNVERIFIED_CONTAM: Nuclear transport factor 2 [Sesamum radiatum]|uniref:Nuclear transport factor 2 n=1 Tax=Sesamum radiatum TaxID=300843 RepID=A0AAW2V5J0_SESRA
MAMQTASPQLAPGAQVVGNAFVEQYYHILHHSPELVYRFYQDTSVLSRPDPNGLMTTVTTMKHLNFLLSISSGHSMVILMSIHPVLICGNIQLCMRTLLGGSEQRMRRYVEESEPDITAGVVGVDDTPSSTLTQDLEPAQVVDPPKPDHATSDVQEFETIEEKDNNQVIDERPASQDRDIVVEAGSHLNENHASVAAESASSASQEDAPKKSYASIVSSQTKKGPTRVYVPANSARVASPKLRSNPLFQQQRLQAQKNQPITHLLLHQKVTMLRMKQQGFCFGFVEFQEFSSMQSAIKVYALLDSFSFSVGFQIAFRVQTAL